MALQRKRNRPKQPRRRPLSSPRTTFSSEHYRELGAEKTLQREHELGERGFPAHGPSLGDEDETASVPEPLPSERPHEG